MKQLFLLFLCLMPGISYAQSTFSINHGPYLQEVTPNGATFVFSTSAFSFSFVELRKEGSESVTCYQHSEHGLKQANTTFFSVRAADLLPNTVYQYRIHAKEMKSFQPYKVAFGDNLLSPWYTFRTVNPQQKGGSIFITSDMHSQPQLLKRLLELCDYKTCTSFFYAGDMMNYMQHGGEHPFSSFIDASVDLFASSVPFELVRGNHETRGDLAREFPSFFPKTNGKLYGSYLLGDVMVVMLDTGEDKAETHPVYANLTDYEAYRTEQAEWLKALISTKIFRKAKYRIVISHFPMTMSAEEKQEDMWHGWQDAIDKLSPVLNKARVDLLVAGHTHRFFYHEPGTAGNSYPMLEQGNNSAARLDIANGRIQVKVIDKEGKLLLHRQL
ncbi:MAG: FN3 domain-containing metallophosphoesterase family protein [Bacteroides sp.]